MKLFPATLTLRDDGSVVFGIRDSDLTLRIDPRLHETDGEALVEVYPPVVDDTPSPQVEFLSACYSAVETMLIAWFITFRQTSQDRQVAHAAVHYMFSMLMRSVEHLPRTAENTLEVALRSSITGIPMHLGMHLLVPHPSELENAPSELEKRLTADGLLSTRQPASALQVLLPPLSYECVFPVPSVEAMAKFTSMLEQRKAERELLAAVPMGSA